MNDLDKIYFENTKLLLKLLSRSLAVAFLTAIMFLTQKMGTISMVLFLISLGLFFLSLLILLHSFFLSERTIDLFQKRDQTQSLELNSMVKTSHLLSAFFLVIGLLIGGVALSCKLIGY